MNLSKRVASTKSTIAADKARISKATAYYIAFIGLGLTSASLGPTLPGLAEQTQSGLKEISFLFAARSLGYLLGSWFGGWLYDRVPGHPVMASALIIIALMLALVPAVPLLWLLTGLLLVIGLAEGALDVGGNTLLVWVYRHEVGPFMNGLHFFWGFGAFLSPIIIAQTMLYSEGITWAYRVLALLVLPVAFWLLRLPSPTSKPLSTDEPPAEQTNYLLVGLIVVFFFLYAGAEVSFGGWIYTYAVAQAVPKETAAYLTSAFWGALTAGRLLAIPIATRLRPRQILSGDLVGCLISISVILLWSDSWLAVWGGALGLGLFMASIFPTTISLAERRMRVTGVITGWFFIGASAGGMSLPWLIGQLFESSGPHIVMVVILVTLVLDAGVFIALIVRSTPTLAGQNK